MGVEQCEQQDEMFALIFTVAVSLYTLPGVLVGYMLHHAGLRVTRISAGYVVSFFIVPIGHSNLIWEEHRLASFCI